MTTFNPDAPHVELSFDDALRMAMGLHRDGRLDGAETLYRRLLQAKEGDANAQHFLGMLLYQRGRREDRNEAIQLMTRSVQADPSVAAWHNNLGNALLEGGEPEAAALAYERCTSLDPDNVDAMNNLGCLLRGLGRAAEAEAMFRKALAIDDRTPSLHANLATLLANQKRIPEAQAHYLRSLELQPMNPVVSKLLGVMYAQTGQLEKATQIFSEWLAREPDNPHARHHLAAVTGKDVPDRAADAYVTDVFDRFSASFDERLSKLEYQAPKLVGECLPGLLGEPARALDIVDAGAGTGLCAPWLRPYARRLVGVDLSGGMLEKAQRRGGYDELAVAELVDWLDHHAGEFDVAVSADTLCYFGKLDGAFAAARRALRDGGVLVFTVEAVDDGTDHCLKPHGRYAHGRAYLLRALDAAGFSEPVLRDVVLRKESGLPVQGFLVSARAAATPRA